MEFLWSPWRYVYIASAGTPTSDCVFCIGEDQTKDSERLVLYRGLYNFVILNMFPYTSGHLMIAPYAHIASIEEASADQTTEMMELAKRAITALKNEYRPEGFNVGMNLGLVAGAGVRDHYHLHIVPRWAGDANFMTVVGETRVLPEALHTTYERLKKAFELNR